MKTFADFVLTVCLGILNFAIGLALALAFLAVYVPRLFAHTEGGFSARDIIQPTMGISAAVLPGSLLYLIGRQMARIWPRRDTARKRT